MYLTSPFATSFWEPLRLLDRLFADGGRTAHSGRLPAFASGGGPAINVWSDADSLHVSAELPGSDPGKLTVNVLGDTLTISGTRGAGGEFRRSVQLPYLVDADRTTAQFKDGVLAVTLQRHEAEKARRIAIETA